MVESVVIRDERADGLQRNQTLYLVGRILASFCQIEGFFGTTPRQRMPLPGNVEDLLQGIVLTTQIGERLVDVTGKIVKSG